MIGMSGHPSSEKDPKTGTQNRQCAKNDCGWPVPLTYVLHKPALRLRENLIRGVERMRVRHTA